MSDVARAEGAQGKEGLSRSLSWLETSAMAFSSCGASAGLFSLFGFSLFFAGPAFFWGWPLVGIGVFLICLVWAELSSHYPYAGVLYQWPARLLGKKVGWWVGWTYLFSGLALLCAYYFILPLTIGPLFNLELTTGGKVGIALGALAVAAIFNALGIRILGRFTELGVAIELFIMFVITTLVLIAGATQSPDVLFDLQTEGAPASFGDWLPGFLGGGMFVSLWVLFTFENAGTLGEETVGGSAKAPRAILLAFGGTMLLGIYFLIAFIIATPDIVAVTNSATPVQDIINNALPDAFSKLYLALLSFVLILGSNVAFTGIVRQTYGMARDGMLPFSRQLSRTRNGSPWVAVVTVAVLTGIPFVASTQVTVLVTGATAATFFAYFLALLATLVGVLKGWPHGEKAAFSLGRWRLPVVLAATLACGAFVVNLLWFRSTTNPAWYLKGPVAMWIILTPAAVGLVYYLLVIRKKIDAEAGQGAVTGVAEEAAGA